VKSTIAALLAAGLLTLTGCEGGEPAEVAQPTTPAEVIAALNAGGFDCEPVSAAGMGAVGNAKFCAPGPVVEGAENYVTVIDDPAGTEIAADLNALEGPVFVLAVGDQFVVKGAREWGGEVAGALNVEVPEPAEMAEPSADEQHGPLIPEPLDIEVGQFATMSEYSADFGAKPGLVRYTVEDIRYCPPPSIGNTEGKVSVHVRFTAANFGQVPVRVGFGSYWLSEDGVRFEGSSGTISYFGTPPNPDLPDELNVGESSEGWLSYMVPAEPGYIINEGPDGTLTRIPVDPSS